jgi:hypothetical protein
MAAVRVSSAASERTAGTAGSFRPFPGPQDPRVPSALLGALLKGTPTVRIVEDDDMIPKTKSSQSDNVRLNRQQNRQEFEQALEELRTARIGGEQLAPSRRSDSRRIAARHADH